MAGRDTHHRIDNTIWNVRIRRFHNTMRVVVKTGFSRCRSFTSIGAMARAFEYGILYSFFQGRYQPGLKAVLGCILIVHRMNNERFIHLVDVGFPL